MFDVIFARGIEFLFGAKTPPRSDGAAVSPLKPPRPALFSETDAKVLLEEDMARYGEVR